MDFGGALGEGLHHILLVSGGLCHDVVVFHLRGGQVQLVGGLDVRHLFEQVHQLRQVKELGKSCPRPVAGPLRGQFQGCHRFPEAAGPAVEMGHVQFLEPLILEVALDGIKFGHTVADRRSGGEHNAPAAGDLREGLSSVFVNFLHKFMTNTVQSTFLN